MDDENIIKDSTSKMSEMVKSLLSDSDKIIEQTNLLLQSSLRARDTAIKRRIRETVRESGKLYDVAAVELEKTYPNFEKISEEAQRNIVLLKNLQDQYPQLTESFAPFLKTAEAFSEEIKKSNNASTKFSKIFTDMFGASDKLGTTIEKFVGNIDNLVKGGTFAILLDALFTVNQQVTEITRGFGLSSRQAFSLRAEIGEAAFASNDLFITSTKLLESFNALSQQLGFQVDISGDLLETYTNLEKRFGFAADEAANLTAFLALQSKNTAVVLENTIKNINASRDSNLLINNTKQILRDVSSASMATVASLGKSPQILGEAAVKARELGLTLAQVEKVADSLLNFESSISNELTAELVTGRQLNLERARFLALTNDIIGLQEEINAQGIDFAEFTDMSRIGQKAIADALGMGREELTQMLFNQEKLTLAQKASRGELAGQSLEQFKAISAQEKLNLAIEKMQDLFTATVLLLSPFIDLLVYITDILDRFIIGPIGKIIYATTGELGGLSGTIANTSPNLQNLSTAAEQNISALTGQMETTMEGVIAGVSPNIQNLATTTILSEQNNKEMIAEIKALRQQLSENNRTPVVIENKIDGDILLRNNVRGDRRGNPNLTTPSVYTGGLV